MAKKGGLGKGFDLIFEDNSFDNADSSGERLTVMLSEIDVNPSQPRKNFDREALQALADSIAQNGILQPPLVRRIGDRYEIVAGERRFRASSLAGLFEIPVIVIEADDLTAAKLALIENLQREDLNPYEESAAYKRLMDEFSLTQEQLSVEVGKSRSAVANSLRLLELPKEVVPMVAGGEISGGHARTLLGLKNRALILPLAKKCAERQMSVRELEALVKLTNKKTAEELSESEEPAAKPDYAKALAESFTKSTGRRCKITDNPARRSYKSITVEYKDNEDLETLIRALAGDSVLSE